MEILKNIENEMIMCRKVVESPILKDYYNQRLRRLLSHLVVESSILKNYYNFILVSCVCRTVVESSI